MDLLFICIAKYVLFLSAALGGGYFLLQSRDRKRKMFIFSCITLPLIGIVAFAGSQLYNNPRPFVVDTFTPLVSHIPDNGFPSGHTLVASAVAAVVFVFNRRLGVALWVIAILIGASRVYVGVHHPIDVIGSILIAGIVSSLVYFVLKKHTTLL